MAKRIIELGAYSVDTAEIYQEVDRAGLVESQKKLIEKVAYATVDGSTGAIITQRGDFLLTSTRLSQGAFQITHNLGTDNYTINVISGNDLDLNKILTSSYSTLNVNSFDCYFQRENAPNTFADPAKFTVRVSFM